jgi:hypothetical protein
VYYPEPNQATTQHTLISLPAPFLLFNRMMSREKIIDIDTRHLEKHHFSFFLYSLSFVKSGDEDDGVPERGWNF